MVGATAFPVLAALVAGLLAPPTASPLEARPSVVRRGGIRLDTSPTATVRVVAPLPPPPPPPPPTPVTSPHPMSPPTTHAGTNPTSITAVLPGRVNCPHTAGLFDVFAPETPTSLSSLVDSYIDYVWRWDGSTWVGVGWGPWASKPRFSGAWTLADGQPADQLTFNATSGSWYAATQWFYDAQKGGYWPQLHPTYLGGAQSFCQVW